MFAKWKSKIKAAIKEAKAKHKDKHNKQSSAAAVADPVQLTERQSDGLSRPHGLGGRRSLDGPQGSQTRSDPAGLPSNNSTALAAGADQLQQPQLLASAAGGQVQHGHSLLQQQQLDQQHANMMAQQGLHQQAPAQPIDCADPNAQHEAGGLGLSGSASPTASHAAAAGGLQDAGSAGGHAVSTQPAAAAAGLTHAAAAADHTEFGSSLAVPAPQQHRPDASRTPRDGELGTCPPYAAKAVWGLRYTMEDKWAAVPNLIQVPVVLTCPVKKGKGSKSSSSGCGCMIPAASKVLAKVSPSSRLSSNSSNSKDTPRSSAVQSPALEKPSPDRQRLMPQGASSSDTQGLQAQDSAGAGLPLGAAAAGADGVAAAAVLLGPGPGMDAVHYFGVFDGHGGADAAHHCAQRMHQVVCATIMSMLSPEMATAAVCSPLATNSRRSTQDTASQLQQEQQQSQAALAAEVGVAAAGIDTASTSSSNTTAAAVAAAVQPIPAIDLAASNGSWLLPVLSRSFVSLDHEFGTISEGSYVGSTAVVVLIASCRMWVAHAGDSRAVLGRNGAVQVLTSDHKASRGDEVARVQAAGGHVWWDRVMGELAVSRAIGDHCLRPYVIPEPELLMVERTPDDEVLVMASDGLWDVMNNQEVVDMALHSLQAAQASGHCGVAAVKRSANALTKAALERGTRDNVTVLVIDLRPRKPGTYEAALSTTHHSSGSNHASRHASSSGGHRGSSKGSSSRSSKKAAAAGAVAEPAEAALAGAGTPEGLSGSFAVAAAPAAAIPAASTEQGVFAAAATAATSVQPQQAAASPAPPLGEPFAAAAAAGAAAAVPAAGGAAATSAAESRAAAGAAPAAAPAAAGAGLLGVGKLERAESAGETNSLMGQHVHSSHRAGI